MTKKIHPDIEMLEIVAKQQALEWHLRTSERVIPNLGEQLRLFFRNHHKRI